MQRLITSVSAENESLLSVHPEIGHVHRSPPPSKAQEHPEEGEERNIRAKGWGGAYELPPAHDSLQLWRPERTSRQRQQHSDRQH